MNVISVKSINVPKFERIEFGFRVWISRWTITFDDTSKWPEATLRDGRQHIIFFLLVIKICFIVILLLIYLVLLCCLHCTNKKWLLEISNYMLSMLMFMSSVFPNGPGSIPGRIIPKTLKLVLNTALLNTQHYKVRIKGRVEQTRKWSRALPNTCCSYWKWGLRIALD